MSPRHRTASTEIESRILSAALKILDDSGVDALTVRGIASEASIAPMGIYNRFDGINGVFEALWIEGFDRLTTQMMACDRRGEPLEDLKMIGRSYRDFARSNAAHYRLMFMNVRGGFVPSVQAAPAGARALQCLIDAVERAQASGDLPQGRSLDLAQGIWAAIHGFVSLEIADLVFAVEPEVACDAMMNALVAGYRGVTR